ncbi:hypothetical protein AEST_30530 [Alishewanella aestuarii B11]|uniref:Glycosyltransferase subfamily 4-like N-terminal domain-containing protein n=1 Tax=Alishewanella aestuarii B11 TaxID=1197174 RepID=J2IC24_9ALTE|nr:glycosyltransferase [Alishewanella aestuarii]EJI84219.1 hypothetical protein AEST_30530 [Alishewanella aestuarii B11]
MKKKLLFITQQVPYPLNDGGNIRTYNMLKGLSLNYSVTLVASVPKLLAKDSFFYEAKVFLSDFCDEIFFVDDVKSTDLFFLLKTTFRSILKFCPISISYNYNKNIMREVERLLGEIDFDVIHLNHLDTWQYLKDVNPDVYVAIDTHNIMFELYDKYSKFQNSLIRRLLNRFESFMFSIYEKRAFNKVDAVIFCSGREANIISTWGLNSKIHVVPNGVDTDYFKSDFDSYGDNPNIVVFTGAMNYSPNDDAAIFFIKEVLPILRERVDKIIFLVVGKEPSKKLLEYAMLCKDVQVTGRVDDVREYIKNSKVYVVPIRSGAGTRLKVLEAFSMGIPTVSTSIGAEGIDYVDGHNILIGDNPVDISNNILDIINNKELSLNLSKNSRDFVENNYDWEIIMKVLLDFYGRKI